MNAVVTAPEEEHEEPRRLEQDDEEPQQDPEKVRVPTWPSSQGEPRPEGGRVVPCCPNSSTWGLRPADSGPLLLCLGRSGFHGSLLSCNS